MKRAHASSNRETGVPAYPQEALLIDAIPELAGDQVICTSAGLAQFAAAAARALPQASVCCTYLDLYRANLALDRLVELPANLRIECAADLPNESADVVALPISASGEAELTRDLIQSGHERLRIGGRMYATIDNRRDKWLREQMGKTFRKLNCRTFASGALYIGTKTGPLKKLKNFTCEFAFRDRGRLIRACSRPGVFSHRHVDVGARRLMDEMHVDPGMRILDIGCGAGVVALAAACRGAGVTVHAVDSSARAIECTRRGGALNELENLATELNAEGGYAGAGNYDLALANPPYYASFRIAEHFLVAGRDALRVGGKILVVTKRPEWYEQNMTRWYDDVTIREQKGYFLVHGSRPAGDSPAR